MLCVPQHSSNFKGKDIEPPEMNNLSKIKCLNLNLNPNLSDVKVGAFSPLWRCWFEQLISSTIFDYSACEPPCPSPGGLFLSPLVSWSGSWAQSKAGLPSAECYLNNSMKQPSWAFWLLTDPTQIWICFPLLSKRSTPGSSVFFCLELYSWKCPVFNFIPKPFLFVWPFVLGWLQRSCLTVIKFNILLAVPIRSLTHLCLNPHS